MDDEGRQLLAEFARSREPSPARRAAAWSAISERIRLGDPGPPLDPDTAPAGLSATGKLGLIVVSGLAVALAVVGRPDADTTAAIAGRMVPTITVDPPIPADPPAAPAASPAAPATPAAPAAHSSPPAQPAAAAPKSERPAARRRHTPRTVPEPAITTPPASSLAEEMKLLRRANGQLKAGQPGRALQTLAEHARRFPEGTLAAEREVKRAEAHCRHGDRKASRKVVDEFLRDHPGTALRSRALSICIEGER